eukprot:scaffold207575_cov28-Prasinocladus_malaysianus.AAC.1
MNWSCPMPGCFVVRLLASYFLRDFAAIFDGGRHRLPRSANVYRDKNHAQGNGAHAHFYVVIAT